MVHPCEVVNEQVEHIVTRLARPADWLDHVLVRLNLQSEVDRVMIRHKEIEGRLKRLGQAYVDRLFADEEYAIRTEPWSLS